jgi:C-terminal processing protease CtpA/Prc
MLPGGIGYVDLDRLGFDMVDSMFRRLRHARAIIFDMRGYPNGTVWAIAPRLTGSRPPVARIETPMVGLDTPRDASGAAFEAFTQSVDPTPPGQWLYTGPTVMLMDERSASQAEHTGMYLRAANGTRFVGGPTAGADGELATMVLPGGITVGFTGQSVRFPDGGEIQRRGLVPDLRVAPTIRGLRQGRDEVLERALEYLRH